MDVSMRKDNLNSTMSYRIKYEWLTAMVFSYIAAAFLLYILIATIYHGYKTKLMVGFRGTYFAKNQNASAVTNSLLLLSACFTFLYTAMALPQIGRMTRPFCEIQKDTRIVFYSVAITAVYFAMWYRVYILFYKDPILKENITMLLRVINPFSVVFLIISSVVNAVIYILIIQQKTEHYGCVLIVHVPTLPLANLSSLIIAVNTIVFQVLILFSLTYPLYMHRKKALAQGFDALSVMPIAKRAAISTGICCSSDLIVAGFVAFYDHKTTNVFGIAYNTNLLINLLSLILSNSDWKYRLTMCFEDNIDETKKAVGYNRQQFST